MQPSKQPRGRLKKKRKTQITKNQALRERSQALSPSPPCAQHADAGVKPSDACAPQVDTAIDLPGAGLSVGQYNANIDIFDFSMEPADAEVS
jgi:hypothetical protein